MNWEREAASRLPGLLQAWLRKPVDIESDGEVPAGVDLVLASGGQHFLVQVKGSDAIGVLERAVADLDQHAGAVGVLVVPYMGPKAREWAARHDVSWVDLSGNAEVRGDGICIVVMGEKNRYAARGRPSNPFTPRYSRVSRALLADANRWWRQVDIASEVDLPTGTVSKVVQRLDALELLERNDEDELRARAPSLLLESWDQRYRFSDHAVRRYHLTARSGEEGLRMLAERLGARGTRFAATGLSAAWLDTAHAGFRINTFFVDQHPSDPQELGLRPADRGENVWLAVPNDDGVFYGRVEQGTWCAHPVQVFLDLAHHPERAKEAAQELRSQWLTWRA